MLIQKVKAPFILLFFLLAFTSCPTPHTVTSHGERNDREGAADRVDGIISNGGIPTSNQINAAIRESTSPPTTDCLECGQEVPGSHTGNDAARFQATKQMAREILDAGEVSNMEQVNFSDKGDFCPRYDSLNAEGRKDFWATLVAVMGIYESGNRPRTSYDEGRTDRTLSGVTSVGILQMSYGSARQSLYRRNGCQLTSPNQLYDPRTNIRCGLAAIKALTNRDNCISCRRNRGASAYWSVLRSPYRAGGISVGKKPQVLANLRSAKPDCF